MSGMYVEWSLGHEFVDVCVAFFVCMFIVSAVSFAGNLVACCSFKWKALRRLGGCIVGTATVISFVLLIIGSIWRWGKTGKACSGDYLPVPEDGNVDYSVDEDAGWMYWNSTGFAMHLVLVITWIVIFCQCCCGLCLCAKD